MVSLVMMHPSRRHLGNSCALRMRVGVQLTDTCSNVTGRRHNITLTRGANKAHYILLCVWPIMLASLGEQWRAPLLTLATGGHAARVWFGQQQCHWTQSVSSILRWTRGHYHCPPWTLRDTLDTLLDTRQLTLVSLTDITSYDAIMMPVAT